MCAMDAKFERLTKSARKCSKHVYPLPAADAQV